MNDALTFYTVHVARDGFPVTFCTGPDYRMQTYAIQASDPGESCGEFEAQYGKENCCYLTEADFEKKVKALVKWLKMQQGATGLGLVYQYAAGLQVAIYAGCNMRMRLGGRSVGVLTVAVDEETKQLKVSYLTPDTPEEQFTFVPVRTTFTVAFDDYPNALRQAGWQ